MLFKHKNQKREIVVKTVMGLEEVLAEELIKLGATDIEILKRAVKAEADLKTVYRINLCSYFALRVLIPLRFDRIHNEDHLYNSVKRINWNDFIHEEQTIAVRASVNSDYFSNSHYVELKTKDAIVDQFKARNGVRPDVDLYRPDLSVNIHIYKNSLTISLDTSGDSLHKRGYRTSSVEAPINEVLAAGLVKLSGWDGEKTFLDPMCGSGTILAEAILQKMNMPPQAITRSFSFQTWKTYEPELWEEVVDEAMKKQKVLKDFKVFGTDIDERSVEASKYNLAEAGLLQYADIQQADFYETQGPLKNYHLVFNPPYDKRLVDDYIIDSYKKIGDTLKQSFVDSEAWIISGNHQALKHLGLRASKKISLFNGPIESKFHKFEVYAGSRKQKKQA